MRFMVLVLVLELVVMAVAMIAYLIDAWTARDWPVPAISPIDVAIALAGIAVLALIGAYRD